MPLLCVTAKPRARAFVGIFRVFFPIPLGIPRLGAWADYLLNLSCCRVWELLYSGKLYFSVLVNFCKKLFGEVCAAGGACLNSDPGFVTITVTIAVCNYDCMQALSASAFSYY
jgi:hypothetical protein